MVLARRRGASPRREPSTAAHALSREDTLGDVISVEAEDIRGLSLTTLLGGFGRLPRASPVAARTPAATVVTLTPPTVRLL